MSSSGGLGSDTTSGSGYPTPDNGVYIPQTGSGSSGSGSSGSGSSSSSSTSSNTSAAQIAALQKILGLGSAVSGVASLGAAAINANAAETAASEEAGSANAALGFAQQVYNTGLTNQQPFLSAGQSSIGQLMAALSSGQYGPGSLPNVPNAPAPYVQPTLAQVQQTPGYQFTQQQGDLGILEGAGAAGGAISGGTLRSLDQYNTGLANNTYSTAVQQALSGYSANLAGYGAQLSGLQQAQSQQAQGFSQLLSPAQLAEGAASNINQTGTATSSNVSSLEGALGSALAAGTVGEANAISSGLTGAAGSATSAATLAQLLPLIYGNQTRTSSLAPG